jgi:hypothetical protein
MMHPVKECIQKLGLNCDPYDGHFKKSDHLVGHLCFNQLN